MSDNSSTSSSSVPPPETSSPSTSPPPPPPPPPPTNTSTNTNTQTSSTPTITSTGPTSSSSVPTSSTSGEDDEPDETSRTPTSTSAPPTQPTEDTPPTSITSSTDIVEGPSVVTRVSTITHRGSANVSPTSTLGAEGGKSFFQNTGAVAGVFSVVGLIVLALIIAFIVNGIRRRKAKKFDREIEAAAREAAAAQPPVGFLDDDDAEDRYNRGYSGGSGGAVSSGAGGGYGAYSDVSSHGTYSQPPMHSGPVGGASGEAYNMREIGSTSGGYMGGGGTGGGGGVSPGEVFDYAATGGAAGAAGIGVARARSMKGANANYGQALQDGSTPYAAFSAPPVPSTSPGPNGRRYTGGYDPARGMDILEAAGMGAHLTGAGAGLARGPSQYQQGGQLDRNKSLSTKSYDASSSVYSSGSGGPPHGGDYPPMPQQQQGGHNDYSHAQPAYGQPAYNQQQPQGRQAAIQEDDDDDAYGGYVVDDPSPPAGQQRQSGVMPNPFDAQQHHQPESVDDGPRILKVANQ
ncbi:hypothetical protein BKA70DRAFT_1428534 [Coprinopsis sp. MPI-PUGE-AT-0042]|nr:hypothetical protein BKA70DRAFT_1428534 [Coprinopsis sp. MPI-PUGE-AT-0042]